jgi:hypothetical protein
MALPSFDTTDPTGESPSKPCGTVQKPALGPGLTVSQRLQARAEFLAEHLARALQVVSRHRRGFGDLDLGGLQIGLVLIRDRLLPQVKTALALPIVVLVCGGTNTGKSTIVNSLAGRHWSPVGSTASFTKRLIALGKGEDVSRLVGAHATLGLLPMKALHEASLPERAWYADVFPRWPENLPVLLDSPDIDSSDLTCRGAALIGMGLVDAIVWVTTQQKYKDEAGITYLDQAMALHHLRLDVFNQALPRHAEALEDLLTTYGDRWPDNERAVIRIEEQPDAAASGLSPEATNDLRVRLADLKVQGRLLKARSITHGLAHAGKHLTEAGTRLRERLTEWRAVTREIAARFERTLFTHLSILPGHDAPFELQASMIRVLAPHLQTPLGDLVQSVHQTAGRALSWTLGLVGLGRGSSSGQEGASDDHDAMGRRDREDLEQARQIIEAARDDLLKRSRRQSREGHPLRGRLHEDIRRLELPHGDSLQKALAEHLHRRHQEVLEPVVAQFENDLEEFCHTNPTLMLTMRTLIPGLSALAAVAGAAVAIQGMALLPGVSEYVLGTIAVPIYRRIETFLPHNVLELADKLSHEPFMQKSRREFCRARRAIFAEMGGWLSEPVITAIQAPNIELADIEVLMSDLRADWEIAKLPWTGPAAS